MARHHRPRGPLTRPARASAPTTLATLTQRTGLPTTDASPSLACSQRQVLTDLQAAGLAHCDAAGGWTRPEHLPLATSAHDDHAPVRAHVAAERAAWRSGHRSRWETERQVAHEELRQHHTRWWQGLTPERRRERLRVLGRRFVALSFPEQAALKRRLARRDQQRGIDPTARCEAWRQAHSREQQQQ